METERTDLESYFRSVAREVAERVYEEKREGASRSATRPPKTTVAYNSPY